MVCSHSESFFSRKRIKFIISTRNVICKDWVDTCFPSGSGLVLVTLWFCTCRALEKVAMPGIWLSGRCLSGEGRALPLAQHFTGARGQRHNSALHSQTDEQDCVQSARRAKLCHAQALWPNKIASVVLHLPSLQQIMITLVEIDHWVS